MRERTPRMTSLARRLVEHEAQGRRDAEALAGATDAIFRKLGGHLEKLIGPAGFQALATRTVAHAALDLRFLEPVRVGADDGLAGLRESVQALRPPPPIEEFAAIPALFLDLLATFIGEDLTLRLVHRAWPEVQLDSATTEEAG